jgi:diguanylate cyclase (GGDEF)-like protein
VLHEDNKLFESVIRITEERDRRSLEKSLIETLSDFIEFEALILLRIPRTTDSEYVEVAASIPKEIIQEKFHLIPHEYGDTRVERDDCISLCLDNGEVISDTQNSLQRMLVPILVNGVVTNILDIYGHHSNSNSKILIRGFLRIYNNFLSILTDNEHDTLTGLLNRKTFDAQISKLFSEFTPEKNVDPSIEDKRYTKKNNTYHWISILDIDHFKIINDKFGHIYGDEVLLLFSNIMEKTFRANDFLFRYGGEEFVAVTPNATEADAFKIYERFRKNVESFVFPQVGQVTVSIGIGKIHAHEHPTTVLEHADKALYYAKEHGRNQVCNYHELIKADLLKEELRESDIDLF